MNLSLNSFQHPTDRVSVGSSATADLQGEYTIESVKVHLANSSNTLGTTFNGTFDAPKKAEAFALVNNEWVSRGQFAINTDKATCWTKVTDPEGTVATQIKIVIVLNAISPDTVWGGLMDEIAVYGEEYVASPETANRLLGDVNNDGEIDKKDYAALKRFCFGTISINPEYIKVPLS